MDLIKQCWDQQPSKRPTIDVIVDKIVALRRAITEGEPVFLTPPSPAGTASTPGERQSNPSSPSINVS